MSSRQNRSVAFVILLLPMTLTLTSCQTMTNCRPTAKLLLPKEGGLRPLRTIHEIVGYVDGVVPGIKCEHDMLQ